MKNWKMFFLLVIVVFVMAACSQTTSDVVHQTATSGEFQEAPTPAVTAAAQTVLATSTAVPTIGVTQAPAAQTPVPTVTSEPEVEVTDEELLVKPGMPEFVTDAEVCGGANFEYSIYVGKEDTPFTTVSYLPAFDNFYDMVIYFVPGQDPNMHFMAWQGGDWQYSNSNRTYIVVRFDRANNCSESELLAWAESHLDDAAVWAASFTEWHTRALSNDDQALADQADLAQVDDQVQCQFDQNPNAFIIKGNGSGHSNIVVTNPIFGEVTIESSDQDITVSDGYTVVDGCYRREFTTDYSGPMALFVNSADGQRLTNHNFFVPFNDWGNQYDAP